VRWTLFNSRWRWHYARAPQSSSERYLPAPSDISQVGTLSDNPAKVALFRSLFRGREDVYAERWRMKDGTWAYRPAGKKDWQAVLASRPEDHKKVDRETRTLYAVTDEVIRQHLTGKKTIGIYPLCVDETCWLLAVDFDKAAWQEDSLAFLATCKRAGIPAYLERSRSGNGGHVWIFFEVPISLLQSLQRKGEVKDCVAEYGQVIADECHHLTAFSFEQVMRQVKAKFVVGLTATPTRKDGHHPIIFMQCGPIRFNLSAREAAERSPFRHLVLPRPTGFRMQPEGADSTIQDAYAALVTNEERNRQIVADIIQTVREGRTPLVLTNRTDHLDRLASGLAEIQHVFILKGGMRKKERQAAVEKLALIPDGEPRVLLATGSYIGEGFDDSRLDTLFLTMPISWRGTLQQYVGRLHRIHHDKKVVRVFDYIDALVPMLARMYEKRLKGYGAIGYEIESTV
jgi:TOTE conflict system, Archaeo-Eukaryotic Primase domain/Type III restriction enzyme, res subunit/Helicase conserved C-terminal domain